MADREVNLKARRGRAWEAANAINNQVAEQNRALTAAETRQYDEHVATIHDCDRQIAQLNEMSQLARDNFMAGNNGHSERPTGRRKGKDWDAGRAEVEQLFKDLEPGLLPGGRMRDVRNTADFVVADNMAIVPRRVAPYLSGIETLDIFGLLGCREYNLDSIAPLTVPLLVAATTAATVAEMDTINSEIPTLNDVTFTPVKKATATAVSLESIRSLGATAGDPNGQLTEIVLTGGAQGILELENSDGYAKLSAALGGNSNASFFNTYGTDYISLIAEMQSLLPIQFRGNSRWLMGVSAQRVLQAAKDSYGRRLFPEFPAELSGRPVVIAPADVISGTEIYLGDWSVGALRAATPYTVRVLVEALALSGAVGYVFHQFWDMRFFAEQTPSVAKQPILKTDLENAGS